jgi:hypothetical protein
MLWEWPLYPSAATKRLTRLQFQPFAGVLPGQYNAERVSMILKPLLVSHIELSPDVRANYGKNVKWINPNPTGIGIDDLECKPRYPHHKPQIKIYGNYVLCQHAGNHGISLRATKVQNLSVRKNEDCFVMTWADHTGYKKILLPQFHDNLE